MLNTKILVLASTIIIAGHAVTHADDRYRPVNDKIVESECGECHMAFQPQMLPKRSWLKIMNNLDTHFGEDASLDALTRQHIETYFNKNAADQGWWNGRFMRGLSDNDTPLHITKTPYWRRQHRNEVPEWAWSDPKAKTKSNCIACHPRATYGDYDDD